MSRMIKMQYRKYTYKYGLNHERLDLDCSQFKRPGEPGILF